MTHGSHEAFVAFVGIDWADAKHDVCLQAAPVPVCVHPVVRLDPSPRWLAAGYILGPLGLLSALSKEQPIEIMPLTSF
jgi:hypothetical protein